MLNDKTELQTKAVEVPPEKILISIGDGDDAVILALPSALEIDEITSPEIVDFALQVHDPICTESAEQLDDEIQNLELKRARFKDSVKILTHLSHLSNLAGNLGDSESYLLEARQLKNSNFIEHELGNVYIDREEPETAWSIYNNCDLSKDIRANLRLAFILSKQNKILEAKKYVDNAICIDATDYSARMFEGAIELWNGSWERAIRSFKVAAEERDTSSALFVNLAAAYWALGQKQKSTQALKRAHFLDPLNINATLFLSDVLFLEGMPQNCIPLVKATLEFYPLNSALWARYARAFYETGKRQEDSKRYFLDALEALKRQAQLSESFGVWNNIGVVYAALQDHGKARRFFGQALTLASQAQQAPEIPLSNLVTSFINSREYKNAYKLTEEYLSSIEDKNPVTTVQTQLLIQNMIALEAIGERTQAASRAEKLLTGQFEEIEDELEFIVHLLFFRTIVEPNWTVIEKYLPRAIEIIRTQNISEAAKSRASNNIIFALLTFGDLEQAQSLITHVAPLVHIDPFVTATYGLFHIKKGNLERAEELYTEAVALASTRINKNRIKQRMNLELGKANAQLGYSSKAVRMLSRAAKQKDGYKSASTEAQEMIRQLAHKG